MEAGHVDAGASPVGSIAPRCHPEGAAPGSRPRHCLAPEGSVACARAERCLSLVRRVQILRRSPGDGADAGSGQRPPQDDIFARWRTASARRDRPYPRTPYPRTAVQLSMNSASSSPRRLGVCFADLHQAADVVVLEHHHAQHVGARRFARAQAAGEHAEGARQPRLVLARKHPQVARGAEGHQLHDAHPVATGLGQRGDSSSFIRSIRITSWSTTSRKMASISTPSTCAGGG